MREKPDALAGVGFFVSLKNFIIKVIDTQMGIDYILIIAGG